MSDGAAPSASDPVASTSSAPAHPTPSRWSVWGPPLLIGLAYLAFWQIAPRIRTESVGAQLLSTIVSLGLIVWFNAQIARGFRQPRQFALSLAVTAIAILPLRVLNVFGHIVPPWSWLLAIKGLPDLLFIWLASSFGGLLSFLLRGANMIPPVAAVLALVDIWTVLLGGPVGKLIKSQNPTAIKITQALTVPLPTTEQRGAAPISLFIGFADFLFVAFFVAAITRFVPSEAVYRRMLIVLIAVLSGYMLIVYFRELNLPALLPLAVVMIALHWRYFQYSRSELFALLYAGLFIALIAAGFWYMGSHGPPPKLESLPRTG
jgi:hypothetical protein